MHKKKASNVDNLLDILDMKSEMHTDPRENVTMSCRMYENYNELMQAIADHYGLKKSTVMRNVLADFITSAGDKLGLSFRGVKMTPEEIKTAKAALKKAEGK